MRSDVDDLLSGFEEMHHGSKLCGQYFADFRLRIDFRILRIDHCQTASQRPDLPEKQPCLSFGQTIFFLDPIKTEVDLGYFCSVGRIQSEKEHPEYVGLLLCKAHYPDSQLLEGRIIVHHIADIFTEQSACGIPDILLYLVHALIDGEYRARRAMQSLAQCSRRQGILPSCTEGKESETYPSCQGFSIYIQSFSYFCPCAD